MSNNKSWSLGKKTSFVVNCQKLITAGVILQERLRGFKACFIVYNYEGSVCFTDVPEADSPQSFAFS